MTWMPRHRLRDRVDQLEQQVVDLEARLADANELLRARLDVIDRLAGLVAEHDQALTIVAGRLDAAPASAAVPEEGEADRLLVPGPASSPAPADVPPPLEPPQSPTRPARGRNASASASGAPRALTAKQQDVLTALRDGLTGPSAIAARTGQSSKAVAAVLYQLRDAGLAEHNGLRAKQSRWQVVSEASGNGEPPVVRRADGAKPGVSDTTELPATGGTAASESTGVITDSSSERPEGGERREAAAPLDTAAPPARPPLEPGDDRIVQLVTEHGPVTATWVADQLLLKRRDCGARMRALAAGGLLVEDGAGYAAPDRAEAA